MQTLLIHTPKGGSGKSTISRELAVAFGANTAIADLDPQQTTAGWYARRQADSPRLVTASTAREPAKLAKAGVKMLVLDSPPGAFFGTSGNWQVDAVLVPVRPTPDDLLSAATVAGALDALGVRWAFVLSQVPIRSRLTASAERQLASMGKVAPVHIHFRGDYPSAAIEGKAAIEFATKAALEISALRDYVKLLMRIK